MGSYLQMRQLALHETVAEYLLNQCVTIDGEPGTVIEIGGNGMLTVLRVYDDYDQIAYVSARQIESVDIGGKTCAACPFWSGVDCER